MRKTASSILYQSLKGLLGLKRNPLKSAQAAWCLGVTEDEFIEMQIQLQ